MRDSAERDKVLVEAFSAGVTPVELGERQGLSTRRVRQILVANNAEAPKAILPKTLEDRIIDPAHQRIGVRLYGFRTRNSKDAQQTADILVWSVKKLRGIERGTTSIDLVDLQVISKFMNLSLCELLKDL